MITLRDLLERAYDEGYSAGDLGKPSFQTGDLDELVRSIPLWGPELEQTINAAINSGSAVRTASRPRARAKKRGA